MPSSGIFSFVWPGFGFQESLEKEVPAKTGEYREQTWLCKAKLLWIWCVSLEPPEKPDFPLRLMGRANLTLPA